MKRREVLGVLVAIVVGVALAVMLWVAVHVARHGSAGLQGPVARGQAAPDFTLKTLEGKDLKLSELRGKAVLVNFWATWCPPCRAEMPLLVEMQKQYGPQGFTIVGVAMDDAPPEEIAAFAREQGVNYPIVKGTNEVGDQYEASGLPTSVFVGRDGKIVEVFRGPLDRSDFEDTVKQALAAGGAGAAK